MKIKWDNCMMLPQDHHFSYAQNEIKKIIMIIIATENLKKRFYFQEKS
jgi:hypothetical protein